MRIMDKNNDLIKLLAETDEWSKTHALVQVYCCYEVELPEGYDPNNDEHKRALLEKFMKENEVEVTEVSDDKSCRYFKMKDGRCSHFDGVELLD
jgi:hypothetical protein